MFCRIERQPFCHYLRAMNEIIFEVTEDEADGGQARRIPGAHRRLHVLGDFFS